MNHTPMDPLGDEPAPRVMRSRGGPLLALGSTISIVAPRSPKWHGQVGTIIKVNAKRYKVETHGGLKVNVPHTMVKEVTP